MLIYEKKGCSKTWIEFDFMTKQNFLISITAIVLINKNVCAQYFIQINVMN